MAGWNSSIVNTDPNPTPDLTIRADQPPAGSSAWTMAEINSRAANLGTNGKIKFVGVFNLERTAEPKAGQTWFGDISTRTGGKSAVFQRKSGTSVTRGFDLKNPPTNDVTISDIEVSGFADVGLTIWKRTLLRRLDIHGCDQKGIGIGFGSDPDFLAVIDTCWVHANGDPAGLGNNVGGYKGIQSGVSFAEPGNGYTFRNCLFEANIGVGIWDDHGSAGALIENCMSRNNVRGGYRWELCNGPALWINCTALDNDGGFECVSSGYAEFRYCEAHGNSPDFQILEEERALNHLHEGSTPYHVGAFKDGFFLEDIKVLGCVYDSMQKTTDSNLQHPGAITVDDNWGGGGGGTPQPPIIASFTPLSGLVGSTVTASGQHFTGTTAVTLAGASASYTVVSDTSLTVIVPAGATTGKLVVTNDDGTTTSSQTFTKTAPSEVRGTLRLRA